MNLLETLEIIKARQLIAPRKLPDMKREDIMACLKRLMEPMKEIHDS